MKEIIDEKMIHFTM